MTRFVGAALTLLAMAGAVGLAWPEESTDEGIPFQVPGVIEIEHPGGVGTSRAVMQAAGRVEATNPVDVVFRWWMDPVAVEVAEPAGRLELWLGDEGAVSGRLGLDGEGGGVLTVRDAAGRETREALALSGEAVALRFAEGTYRVEVDGEVVGAGLSGADPEGEARVRMRPRSSFRASTVRLENEAFRTVDGGGVVSRPLRATWAAVSVLLAVACLRSWWRALNGSGEGRPLVLLVGAGLVACAVSVLHAHNAERLGTVPDPCAEDVLDRPEERLVRPSSPYDLDRRDGDFVLSADVKLSRGSVIDVLLRASPADRDTGLILTLSTDTRQGCSLSRNLGSFFDTTLAPVWLSRLDEEVTTSFTVRCEGADTVVHLDGEELARVRDHDLRAGRIAFTALAGQVLVSNVRVEPLGQPQALPATLTRWQGWVSLTLVIGLVLATLLAGRGVGGALWCWPLLVGAAPGAPDTAWVPGLLAAAVLLMLTPRPGRRLPTWGAGALVLAAFGWAATEEAPRTERGVLNEMRVTDVWGLPLSREYMWARHPLCRRFSTYVRSQRFRDKHVNPDKPEGWTRIAALGSSSTFGYGVPGPAAFIKRLEAVMKEDGYRVQGMNAGQSGATAERLRFFLASVLMPFEPDVVVVNLSFNDHVQNAAYDERAHFAAMSTTGIGLLPALWARAQAQRDLKGFRQFFSLNKNDEPIPDDVRERFSTLPSRRFAASLRDMVMAVRDAGAEIVLVQEPYNRRRGKTPIEPFHAAMAGVAAELDVPLVSPQAFLDAEQEAGVKVFVDTVHPNRRGHEIIARLLAETLVSEGLVTR